MNKLALLIPVLLIGAAPPESGFCDRLAVQTGMKPMRGAPNVLEVNLLSGLGKALFGGSSVIGIRQEAGELDLPARERFDRSCDATAKGAYCKIEAPNSLILTLNGRQVRETAARGEAAIVSVVKGRIRCTVAIPSPA